MFQIDQYVAVWLNYQSLWDLQADTIYAKLGTDIKLWIDCLNDIK